MKLIQRYRFVRPFMMLLATCLLLLTACGTDGEPEASSEQEDLGVVRMGFDQFPDDEAINGLAQALLPRIGYEAEIVALDIGIIYQGVARSDLDVYSGSYGPVIHADYFEEYGDALEKLGPVHCEQRTSLAVPAFMTDVNSIEDLKNPEVVEQFDGKLSAGDPGAGTTRLTREAVKAYGLEDLYEVGTSSFQAVGAEINRAIENHEPLLFTGYSPNWWFARWDLKFLEDPKEAFGKNDCLYNTVRADLSQDKPEVHCFYDNMELSGDLHNEIILSIYKGATPPDAARDFIEAHPDVVEEWLSGC